MEAGAALREQARGCEALGSPMYAGLLDALADDHDAGGPTATVLAGHGDDPGPSALGLRLLGSVHRLVLERRVGALAASYPSVGGTWRPGPGVRAVLDLLATEPDLVGEWLDRPPQTNEVGRAAVLLGGLRHLPAAVRLPVRLVELGASGGLNLLADLLPVSEDAWQGEAPPAWPDLRVVERLGGDPHPLDPHTTEGRLALTAYVWADQPERHERLRAALEVARMTAQAHPVVVRRCGAAELLAGLEPRNGVTTVVWHSVVWQYLDPAEQDDVSRRLEALGEQATAQAPLVHLAMEPRRATPGGPRRMLVTSRTWPASPEERVLGVAQPHGPPVVWSL